MPKEVAEWPVRTYIGLYTSLEKDIKNLRMTRAESKAFESNLQIYFWSYFPDAFGDTGALQGMQDLESRPLAAEMAEIKHKPTGLSLEWKRQTLLRLERVQQNSKHCYAM